MSVDEADFVFGNRLDPEASADAGLQIDQDGGNRADIQFAATQRHTVFPGKLVADLPADHADERSRILQSDNLFQGIGERANDLLKKSGLVQIDVAAGNTGRPFPVLHPFSLVYMPRHDPA